MLKATLRTKSVTTKVTEAEYARLEERAGASRLSLSEWVRGQLLAASPEAGTEVVLAEMLALRTILLNLFFQLGQGAPVEPEEMKALIERADAGKREKALAKLQAASCSSRDSGAGRSRAVTAEWTTRRPAGWPSDRPVWAMTALLLAIATIPALLFYQYRQEWTALQRYYLGAFVQSQLLALRCFRGSAGTGPRTRCWT
ncbi:MAG: hypothetical protein M3Y72_21540 [Acidobacteriota bacterium]|nr:hypothetical protein [Acidobacteriota bacterium]